MRRPLASKRPIGPLGLFRTSNNLLINEADIVTQNTIEELSDITGAPIVDVLFDDTLRSRGISAKLIDDEEVVLPLGGGSAFGRTINPTSFSNILPEQYNDALFIAVSTDIPYMSMKHRDVRGLYEWILSHEYSHVVQEWYKNRVDEMLSTLFAEELITLKSINNSLEQSLHPSLNGPSKTYSSKTEFIKQIEKSGVNSPSIPVEQLANSFANTYTELEPEEVEQKKSNTSDYMVEFNEKLAKGELDEWSANMITFDDSVFSIDGFNYVVE